MKQWRPENWDIMDYCSVEEQMAEPLLAMHFFEAGADAMHKADAGYLLYRAHVERVGDFIKLTLYHKDWEEFIGGER